VNEFGLALTGFGHSESGNPNQCLGFLSAPRVGLEPTTFGLTVPPTPSAQSG
jgi:hypothetical protein